METTEKQKQASRENGQLGGVKTEEGKAISRMNSVKHGILSNFQTKMDHVDFNTLFEEFADEFGVATPSRRVIVEQLTMVAIRLLRCSRYESDKLKEALNPPEYKMGTNPLDFHSTPRDTLVKKNDKAPVDSHYLSQLETIYERYEPTLFKRFQELVALLKNNP